MAILAEKQLPEPRFPKVRTGNASDHAGAATDDQGNVAGDAGTVAGHPGEVVARPGSPIIEAGTVAEPRETVADDAGMASAGQKTLKNGQKPEFGGSEPLPVGKKKQLAGAGAGTRPVLRPMAVWGDEPNAKVKAFAEVVQSAPDAVVRVLVN